jgi:hypothetical protein
VSRPFVPAAFEPPRTLVTEAFELEPLGPEHNESDYDAWTSSIEHIRASPGYGDRSWPKPMTLDENLRDLEMHAGHFAERRGFTYTVLDPQTRHVIGCVYIYPDEIADASVRSWVRATHAELDQPLRRVVADWLDHEWPFEHVDYAR